MEWTSECRSESLVGFNGYPPLLDEEDICQLGWYRGEYSSLLFNGDEFFEYNFKNHIEKQEENQ
jgi:hypothetical protein